MARHTTSRIPSAIRCPRVMLLDTLVEKLRRRGYGRSLSRERRLPRSSRAASYRRGARCRRARPWLGRPRSRRPCRTRSPTPSTASLSTRFYKRFRVAQLDSSFLACSPTSYFVAARHHARWRRRRLYHLLPDVSTCSYELPHISACRPRPGSAVRYVSVRCAASQQLHSTTSSASIAVNLVLSPICARRPCCAFVPRSMCRTLSRSASSTAVF